VVVGGGITALEIVEGLHARRVLTHYFIRRERYWSNVLDEAESRIVEERLCQQGVQLHYHTELAAIAGRRGRVAAVQTETGERIDCDLVAIAIGVRPRSELATGAGLRFDRGVMVDEHLASSAPDVFAAGDVAQVFDPLARRAVLDTLWTSAVPQGRAAGQNMAGQATAYRKAVPFNVTRLAGLTTTIIGSVSPGRGDEAPGIARGASEGWQQAPDALAVQSGFEVNHLRLIVGTQTLLGAVVMGDQAPSRPLQQLIAAQADVSSIRDRLLRPGAPLGDVIAGFWADWRERHATS
jgi:NAD(P)H-nitrite reductase large subunit